LGKILLYAVLCLTAFFVLSKPWIGVVVSYFFIILTPQNIWWWHFEGVRHVFLILLPTILGFFFQILSGGFDLEIIKNKRNLCMAILFLLFNFAYFFGPYVNEAIAKAGGLGPDFVRPIANKIFLLYFIAAICIDSKKKLKLLVLTMIISTAYLIYWANDQYLFQGVYGRLRGPRVRGGGTYADQNSFAMLFVVGLPYIYYLGCYFKSKIKRYATWLIIPLGWHAIFLTGSRGGLVGIAVTLVVVILRSKNKIIFGSIVLPLFLVAYIWQAGDVMRNRAQTIDEYETETSASTRLEAWGAAIEMIKKHPITGVGLASFVTAFPYFSDKDPRQAHNTFFQITAELGIFGGIAYLYIVGSGVFSLWIRGKKIEDKELFIINEAVLVSIVGFFVCSMFLTLYIFEIFYFLCVLMNSTLFLAKSEAGAQ